MVYSCRNSSGFSPDSLAHDAECTMLPNPLQNYGLFTKRPSETALYLHKTSCFSEKDVEITQVSLHLKGYEVVRL